MPYSRYLNDVERVDTLCGGTIRFGERVGVDRRHVSWSSRWCVLTRKETTINSQTFESVMVFVMHDYSTWRTKTQRRSERDSNRHRRFVHRWLRKQHWKTTRKGIMKSNIKRIDPHDIRPIMLTAATILCYVTVVSVISCDLSCLSIRIKMYGNNKCSQIN